MRISTLVLAAFLATVFATGAVADDKQVLFDKGLAAKNSQDFDTAIADFDKAIAADPKWATAYEFRGASFAAKAEASEDPAAAEALIDKAIADYDMVVHLGAPTARTYTLRGIALTDNGNFKDALGDFDRALKLDPDFLMATRAREFAANQLSEQDRAIAIDGDLLRFQPKNIDLLLSRAALLARAGRRDDARLDIDKVLEIDPKNEAALAQRDVLQRTSTKDQPAVGK